MLVMLPFAAQAAPKTPNILFIIMDDVGIDQMKVFSYGGEAPPSTPTIDTIAAEGIRFRNTWSMPACSTSRAVIFTGRFPIRTNVYGALGPSDLANSQVSPYEKTLPGLLKQGGYQSALFGKFHLGLQGKSPFRDAMPRALGWDYFYGWLDETGDPSSIDTTAGNVGLVDSATGKGPYSCGFVPGAAEVGGADQGACYAADGRCQEMKTAGGVPPGRQCRDSGGILDPGQRCKPRMPTNIESGFQNLSAHYVSPLVINDEKGSVIRVPPRDIRARTYRGTVPVDAAIDWIKRQPKHQPWMASVSFASAHTPVMQPPQALLKSDPATSDPAKVSALRCSDGEEALPAVAQRLLTNLMVEALDAEFARLLVATGLAQRERDGSLKYNPHNNDTMIVIVGDNGSLGSTVKPPFDPTRAKGTAYQTGVWVPLVVAGPLVKKPDRDVPHMVNIADLYRLFGEIAGIDVPASVPRRLDAQSMLPYLKNPDQASIRSWNFTQVGPNLQVGRAVNPPCVIGSGCTQIPVTETVCTDNAGVWWGPPSATARYFGRSAQPAFAYCCQVNEYQNSIGQTTYNLQPLRSVAVRNDHYKLVKNFYVGNPVASSSSNCQPLDEDEFYRINEDANHPLLDYAALDLLKLDRRTPEEEANLVALRLQLQAILRSEPPCPGDGNIDGVVNQQDTKAWAKFAAVPKGTDGNNSSWYDFNLDGLTNVHDLDVIRSQLQTQCR